MKDYSLAVYCLSFVFHCLANLNYYALNKMQSSDWLNTNLTLDDVRLAESNVMLVTNSKRISHLLDRTSPDILFAVQVETDAELSFALFNISLNLHNK